MLTRRITNALLAGATALAFTAPAMADVDMSGETVEWIIPFKEGGGSDKWSRFYAPLLSEALPGKPTVVVKNMPGAGSTKGANFFQQRADNDGYTIFGSSGSTQFPYLLGDPRVKYEYKDWNVVLASPTGGVVYVNPELGVGSAGDLGKIKDKPLLYGSQGATSLDLVPLLAFEMLGMNVEPVFGMKGRGAGRLAFERGETNIDYQTSSSYLSKVVPLVEEGKATPIMSWGALDEDGNIVRDPTFPDLPSFKEVCEMTEECKTEGAQWEAWKGFFVAGFPAQKMVFLPKGTDPEIVEVYSNAFKAVTSADDFREKSEVRLGVYPQMTGKAAKGALDQAVGVPDDAKAWVKDWLKERFGVEL